MKKIIYSLTLGLSLTVFFSCHKKNTDEPTVSQSAPDYSKADDAAARNELDRAYDDIEAVYNSQEYSNARTSAVVLPCGSFTLSGKNYNLHYASVNCGSRVLSGDIDVTLVAGTKFSDAGARLKIVFTNYKVLYNANQQSIVYNGTAYVTNETGGTLVGLFSTSPAVTPVIHHVRGGLSLTFDSTGLGNHNVIRDWNMFRKKTYNSNGTQTGITLKFEGDTSFAIADSYIPGSYSNVSEYGTGREGYKFVCTVPTYFFWANCGSTYDGPYTLKQGQVNFTTDLSTSPLAIYGVYKGVWTATAGYRYAGGSSFVLDGSCGSNAYKIDASIKNNMNADLYSNPTVYQPY